MKRRQFVFCITLALMCLLCGAASSEAAPHNIHNWSDWPIYSATGYGDGLLVHSSEYIDDLYVDLLCYLDKDNAYELTCEYLPGFGDIQAYWVDRFIYPHLSNKEGTLNILCTSDTGEIYSFTSQGLVVSRVTVDLQHQTATIEKVCNLDLTEYITTLENSPLIYDLTVVGRTMYLVLGYDPSKEAPGIWGMHLLACDLDTGSVREVAQGAFSSILPEEGGTLLALRANSQQLINHSLVRVDPRTGTTTVLSKLKGEWQVCLRRDEETGLLYYTGMGGVYTYDLNTGKNELMMSIDCPHPEAQCAGAAVVPGVGYTLVVDGRVLSRQNNTAEQLLTIGGPQDSIYDQYKRETGRSVRFLRKDGAPTPDKEFAEAMIMNSGTPDIFLLNVTPEFTDRMKDGFFARLGGSRALRERGAALREPFRGMLCRYGSDLNQLSAVPLTMRTYCAAGCGELSPWTEPPETLPALLDALIAWRGEHPEDDVALFSDRVDAYAVRMTLAGYCLDQYWCAYRMHSRSAGGWLQDALTRLDALCALLDDGCFAAPGEPYRLELTYPLFPVNLTSFTRRDMSAYTSLILPLNSAQRTRQPITMTAYVINPNSARREEAVAYLEYVQAHLPAGWQAAFYADHGEAPNPAYTKKMARLAEQQAELSAQLAAADPDDPNARDALTLALDKVEADKRALRGEEWDVSPESMARYASVLPLLTSRDFEMPADTYADLLTGYLNGEIAAEGFCEELYRRQEMWMLENNIY